MRGLGIGEEEEDGGATTSGTFAWLASQLITVMVVWPARF
jgi:hypothetical protein